MPSWADEQMRAFGLRPRVQGEPRDPAGRWTAVGQASHLHGRAVTGLAHNRRRVTGVYNHHARTVTPRHSAPVVVSHVRPPEAEHAGPTGGLAPFASRTAETATASTVPEPVGKPGGKGLWGKGWQLPPYIQHVANDLRDAGHPESEAVHMAVGIVENWKDGHDGHGHPVHPDVQAAASKAWAEWTALKARAHATRSSGAMADTGTYDSDGLDASWDGDHGDLPDLTGLSVDDFEAVAGPGEGGDVKRLAKLGTGGRFAALKSSLASKGASNPGALAAWIGRRKFGKAKFAGLAHAARKRAAGPASRTGELFRTYALEDCRIITRGEGDGSGRVVEAYAAVFGEPAEITDHQGHYAEEIIPGAFNAAIARAHPQQHAGQWDVAVLYNHGLTVHGSPAERFSMPCGVPVDIREETRGLLTRTEYAATPLGEEILELVRMGALRSQSFTGGIMRSDPMLRGPGDKYRRAAGGGLQRVRRLVLGLREYGLTPFPAYSGAEVCGVRMQLPGAFDEDAAGADQDDAGGTDQDGAGPGAPPGDGDSPGSPGHRIYALRTAEALTRAGIVLPGRE